MEHVDLVNSETIYGAIVVLYVKKSAENLFRVVTSHSGKISFLSGAMEPQDDGDLIQTVQREILEEVGLSPNQYGQIEPSGVYQEFVFGSHKKERAGNRAKYQMFFVEVDENIDLKPVDAVATFCGTRQEIIEKLSFDDVREVFIEALAKKN